MKKPSAQLKSSSNETLELPVYEASIGMDVMDITSLIGNSLLTYDPGYGSTASCRSAITYIDGDAGVLLHRGYPIEQLAERSDYLEVCYLLFHGELPSSGQRAELESMLREHCRIRPGILELMQSLPDNTHPMAKIGAAMFALSGIHHAGLNINDAEQRWAIATEILAQMPILVAACLRQIRGEEPPEPNPDLDYLENFLQMLFGEYSQTNKTAINRLLILHADHEQNASTATVRTAGSTGTNPYAAIASGIAALWGPAHGGANEAVLNMLEEIGDVNNISEFIARARDRDDPFRLMGFGHRVYNNFDPRARVIGSTFHDILEELNESERNTLDIARKLERIALEDDYFIEKKLYPNVDFYSGIIMHAMGFPVEMFTSLFAMGRAIGWISQWHEMLSDGYRITRPRQLYNGSKRRDYP